MLKDRRVILTVCLLLGIGVHFWAGSRVPALNEKALMGGDTELDALGFEVVLVAQESDPLLKRAAYTTVNWVETNRKGMTFGVIFGSILMVLISLFKKKSTNSAFANSLLGMTIGAPLGVCVNCAAPIAQGLHNGGARVETVMAAMVSSPTMNIIVLTMLFALFPPYMVALKLGLTLGFILVVIPLTSRWLFPQEVIGDDVQAELLPNAACALPDVDVIPSGWLQAATWVTKSFFTSLWYVVRTTVPLMFVAGFLGSLIITALPWDTLADIVPNRGPLFTIASMGVIAVVGLTLPVPISFDVLVPAILMSAGMPAQYAMVLLFTLGIFSIYPFFIIWNSISKKMALVLTAVLVLLGMGAGEIGERLFQHNAARQRDLFFSTFGEAAASSGPSLLTVAGASVLPKSGESAKPLVSKSVTTNAEGVSVTSVAFSESIRSASPPDSGPKFTRILGRELGILDSASYTVENFIGITRYRGVAAGDVNNDGWTDLLFATNGKPALYLNNGGERFESVSLEIPELSALYVTVIALVDLNNDRALDIFLSTYRNGNYVAYSQNGSVPEYDLQPLPGKGEAVMTAAASFGDLDRDGQLEIGLGNFRVGAWGRNWTSHPSVLLENRKGSFEAVTLPGTPGEAQAALFSDINQDGALDLIIGNDFATADYYYIGDGTGRLRALSAADTLVPHSSTSTMSIASADINNDLHTDLYLGQITGFQGQSGLERLHVHPDVCQELGDGPDQDHCRESLALQQIVLRSNSTKDPFRCQQLKEEFQDDCIALMLLSSASRWSKDPELCKLFPPAWDRFSFVCEQSFRDANRPDDAVLAEDIPQIRQKNVLLRSDSKSGNFTDVASDVGVDTVGWTWAAKFADLDNDEWQDLYVVNGEFFTSLRESNFLFRNNGTGFTDGTDAAGLGSFLATTTYAYVDIDNDGDLDIVVPHVLGPVSIYRNDSAESNSIVFELRDRSGNYFGIGSKVTIHYAGGTRHQFREIQLGGGFASYDPMVAHFGLGAFEAVERVEVEWSTGERSQINTPLAAGSRYRIHRPGPS